ncbi:DUF4097 family beta strand repeat-containing protein [Streptomyces sp. NPDC037389]|uniref:DUF4097 family beta strand repeat-containing protein n=1 Tax=Streptomyces sp. NPDC037389 TaxID=3155369 RepID=UPI00340D22AB
MTERFFKAEGTGPIVLGLSLSLGKVLVSVDPAVSQAEVMLHTDDTSGPGADAVLGARVRQDGRVMSVEVPEITNAMVAGGGGMHVVQNFGTVTSSVVGATIINGRVVSGGAMPTIQPLKAVVILPPGSSVAVVTTSADAVVAGEVERLEFRSVSGAMAVETARSLTVDTTSGRVRADRVTSEAAIRSVSGSTTIHSYSGSTASVTSTSGTIRVTATAQATGYIRAESVSGDVHVTGADHLTVHARSLSGYARAS